MSPKPSSSRSSRRRNFPHESHGITVNCPREPYESQKQMTDTLLEAVLNGQNCLLESPTGTGKTFAILCTLLAHREHEIANVRIPKTIYYASHTIPQLSHVKKQLSKTSYAKNIRAAITASRKYLCINEEVQRYTSLDDACHAMRDIGSNPRIALDPDNKSQYPKCEYFQNIKGEEGRNPFVEEFRHSRRGEQLWDIEDIVDFGKDHSLCPYYGARAMAQQADIILCPYNYLLHPFQRDAMGFNISDSIIVFDEAHHVESTCIEIGSAKISRQQLRDVVLPALEAALQRPDVPERKRQPLNNLVTAFNRLANWLHQPLNMKSDWILSSRTSAPLEPLGEKQVHRIMDPLAAFQSIGWGPEEVVELYKDSLKTDDKYRGWNYDPEAARFKIPHAAMRVIRSFTWALKVLFTGLSDDAVEDNRGSYSVDAVTDRDGLELCVTCLNPAIVFKTLSEAYAIVLTSATLAPLEPYAAELGVAIPHKLIAKATHEVDPSNVFAGVVTKYRVSRRGGEVQLNFSSETLASSYEFERQAQGAAEALRQIFRNCPGGVIVYMSSKTTIRRFKEFWERRELLTSMTGPTAVFFESEFTEQDYKKNIKRFCKKAEKEPNGAIMFAVCGGRVSESVDLKEEKVRTAVFVGIPNPPVTELMVMRKREYHDRLNRANPEIMDGWTWYERMAFRVMNQAVERCFRHGGDWGVIIFIDERMETKRVHLPQWVNDSWRGEGSVETMTEKLKGFLDNDGESEASDTSHNSCGDTESGSDKGS